MHNADQQLPFRLGLSVPFKPVARLAERLLGLHRLAELYRERPPTDDAQAFLEHVLKLFEITTTALPEPPSVFPEKGGVVVVANHPFGGLEGIVLAHVLGKMRGDVKVMANQLLLRIPELRSIFIGVDNMGSNAAARNHRPMREAIKWLRSGGVLIVFPAGEVASPHGGHVQDAKWQSHVARLVSATGATVVPAWFEGRNSALFYTSGKLHPRLRTLLLARELLNKRGAAVSVRFGQPISAEQLAHLDAEAATALLRLHTEALRGPAAHTATNNQPIAEPVAAALLAAEVLALPPEQCLDSGAPLSVYFARADQIPFLLLEIGRLREVTFRATGEGTGGARDVDVYDNYYEHLFVWNRQKQEIVGAYRLGLTDHIVSRFGIRGLYTHSLFRYRRRLLDRMGPAIELGRSFVRPEYQRSYAPLLLLWKGIGRFVAAHPKYRILFGPVSISNEYQTISQRLMVEFLRENCLDVNLARHIRPRKPFRLTGESELAPMGISDLDRLSEVITELEADQKGVPVLLRQYLKLGGRILGFNIDPDFANALDALIMVDLVQTEPRVLSRYMGREEMGEFLAVHRRTLSLAS